MAFGDPAAEVKGIDAFPPENIPPLWLTFVSFHNMVMLGGLFIALLGLAFLQQCRRRLLSSRKLLWALFLASPLPLVASELGWITAEVGRQPWIVYQVLRTRDAVSHNLTAVEVWISLTAYVLVYGLLLALYLFVILHLLKKESSGGEALA
jgi:cytochrome d ubiquinol oxidase subunit I